MTTLLKVLVGSRAHKLHTETSDYDYRGVFVVPTEDFLKIGIAKPQQTSWIEGDIDDTSWEIGKFLFLATKCNPSILEVFKAPVIETTEWGNRLQNLFPYIWNSTGVKNGCVGYAYSQRKKFLEDKDNRAAKYAVAFLRTLYMAHEILTIGDFSLDLSNTEIFDTAKRWKAGNFTHGEVIQTCYEWEKKVNTAYENNPNKETELEIVNDFLLDVRYSLISHKP